MTTPSTIEVLRARFNGQDLPVPEPVRKEKPVKPVIVMTEEQQKAREEMRSKLQVGTWIIEFKKVDGTPAIMEATLDPRLLPPADPALASTRPEQAHLLHVYAVDRQGWRSFHTNNVTRFYRAAEAL